MKAVALTLAVGLVGFGIVVGCGDDDAPATSTPTDGGIDTGTPVEAKPGPSPFLRVVNNLGIYGTGGDARVCVSIGDTQLLDTPFVAPNLVVAAPSFSAEAGAKLVTSAVTFHLVPMNITSSCAEAVKSTDPNVVHLPEFPVGTFEGNRPYVVTFLGCQDGGSNALPKSCTRKSDGAIDGTASTIRASVTPLDTSAVDSASIGFQFINASLGVNAIDETFKVKAIATGGWNDGPKPLGGALGFGEKPEITAALTIPAIGFVPPSTGGFETHAEDVANTKIASASAASFSDVKFAAGNRYIVMSVGTGATYTILAFALPTADNAPAVDAGASVATGPWVSFFNDSEDTPDFTPCFLASDNTALNPSSSDQGIVHPYLPTPIRTNASANWTGEVRLVFLPKNSPHACDGTTSAAIGIDNVKLLKTFPAGTFNPEKSYMAMYLGCELTPFELHPACYADWNGGSTTAAQPSRRVEVVELDGTSVGAGAIGVQFLLADPFIQAGPGSFEGKPQLLELDIVAKPETIIDTPFATYASPTSTYPRPVPDKALRFPNALDDQTKAIAMVMQQSSGGTLENIYPTLTGSLADIESYTTRKNPTFTFFQDGKNYVIVAVAPALVTNDRRLVAVPTRW